MLAVLALEKLCVGLQCFGAHRSRRQEQRTLRIMNVVIDELNNALVVLDPVNDQIDIETAERIRELGGSGAGGEGASAVEQQISFQLDVTEAAGGQLARLKTQRRHLVHGEAEAALEQCRQPFGFTRLHGAYRALRELKHERRGNRAVGSQELEQLGKSRGVGQCLARQVAEQSDFAILEQ